MPWKENTLYLNTPVKVGELEIKTIEFQPELTMEAYDLIPVSGLSIADRGEIWPIAEKLCNKSAEFLRENLSLKDKDEVVSRTLFLSIAHLIPQESSASSSNTQS